MFKQRGEIMNSTITIKTGNPIVDEIATLNISGNVIPESWYHTITNENGKVNCLAIHILADIVYWYRPTEHRDESTLSVTYTKKFHDDHYLQRSYDQLMQKFNISKKQAYDAVVALENLGLSEKDALTIVKASGNDISKCKTAKSILCQQTQKIQNVFGWLIRAVTENYQSVSKKPAAKKNSFHDYQQRDYDFEELEKILIANPVH